MPCFLLCERNGNIKKMNTAFSLRIIILPAILLSLLPFSALAEEKTIGVVLTGNISYYKEIHDAFSSELAAGFPPGSIKFLRQNPNPDQMSWVNAVQKLSTLGSDIIISYGAPATLVAISEAGNIPVVFAGVYDPAELGLTGKNATGVSSKVPVAGVLKNLKSITPFSKLGVVYNDAEKDTVLQANDVKQLEAGLKFSSVRINYKKPVDSSKIADIDALLLTTACTAMHCVNNIIDIARQKKIPVVATISGGEGSGVILSIFPNPAEQGREAAKKAALVLKGTKPSAIPFEQPKKIDMVINMKEATALGLKVPFDLLTSATRVIK